MVKEFVIDLRDVSMKNLIKKLEENYKYQIENEESPTKECLEFYKNRIGGYTAVMYVPHKENYEEMLSKISKQDIVCDMGAGDLRFALMASQKCKKIYAVEMCPKIVSKALEIIGWQLPRNLIVICADWRYFPIPKDVTFISCMVNMPEDEIPIKTWKDLKRPVFHGITNPVHYDGELIKEVGV